MKPHSNFFSCFVLVCWCGIWSSGVEIAVAAAERPNIVFILIDDLRTDVVGYNGHPFLETPHIDKLAYGGARFSNAFVTTSLCSPSRASYLTGQYTHNHGVVDNHTPIPEGSRTFAELLQESGYQTAFIGKWHMGSASDAPRPGFDHWVSFRGQGRYQPEGRKLNVDGKHVPRTKYMTDELTDYAVGWIKARDSETPFMLELSHKGIHGLYIPAPRHRGVYSEAKWQPPATMHLTPRQRDQTPMWVLDQRNSWHGVEFPYYLRSGRSLGEMYRRYCEMMLSIDESVGRVVVALKAKGLFANTLIVFTSDNGHLWGEHGLIDKRCAYAESIRVPLAIHYPPLIEADTKIDALVTNLDIAPTFLDLAGVPIPESMDGQSLLALFDGEVPKGKWRDHVLYEYYWEWSYPQTPTTFALITKDYKLIQYHGIWDMDELYHVADDPNETTNLIHEPDQRQRVTRMRKRLHAMLKKTGGLSIPLGFKRRPGQNQRNPKGSSRAEFPPAMIYETK